MRLGTHVAGGVFAYTLTATFFQLPWTATGVVLAAAAAAAPDVDTLGSTVGRALAPVARRVERRFGHRTITHCYAAQAAVALLALPLLAPALPGGPRPHLYAAAVTGYLSHPFLDTLTVQGVRVFWPWSDRRGVFPFYNRQPTAYRTATGARADTALGVALFLLTVPVAVVHADGYPRLVRRVQADAAAAVRDFLDWSAEGYLVAIDVEASDPEHLRRLTGTFEAVGTTGAHTLLVRDTTSGVVLSLGPAYAANFQPDRVVAHRGRRVAVARHRVDLAGRVLADLDDLVPRSPAGTRARHLLDGQVTLAEPAEVTPDPFRFNTVAGTNRHLRLQVATLDDLDRLGLAGALVHAGALTLRVFADGSAPETPATLRAPRLRRVTAHHRPSEPPRLAVAPGRRVAAGDTLAVLASDALDAAALDVDLARADADAARAQPLPYPADADHARARLADAERDALNAHQRLAEGFESPAAAHAARAQADALRAALALADARHADALRAHAERVRAADARLRRARLRYAAAARTGTVRAPVAGIVRRAESRDQTPDRAELLIVLEPLP